MTREQTVSPADVPRSAEPKAGGGWPGGLVPAALAVMFWAYIIISRAVGMPMFTLFLTRMAAGALWVLALLVWWLSRRRVKWADRLLVLVAAGALGAAVAALKHPSLDISFLIMLGVPSVLTAWTLWMLVARRTPAGARRLGLLAAIAVGWAPFLLVRMNGLTGDMGFDLHWRWTPSAEELYLAHRARGATPPGSPVASAGPGQTASAEALELSSTDWPEFRGAGRDGIVPGLKIRTDWSTHPPRVLWRQRIGPAWSSVSVVGDRLFTQEQRGESETVVCLGARDGREIWACSDPVRHSDPQGGVGPRATPTFWRGRVFTLGATGLLSCLDATSGRRVWRRDVLADAAARKPDWGFASSPLVVAGLVVVYAGGDQGKGLLAYQAETGTRAWSAPAGRNGYASPQLVRLQGMEQILMFCDAGIVSVNPVDGAVVWKYDAPAKEPRSVQPHALDGRQVLFANGLDLGTTRLDVAQDGGHWNVTRAWTSRALKPSFNDFVVSSGSVYGFDGSILSCIDVATGERHWKQGRYGHGQLLLLAEQHLLLILGDGGQVALVAADPAAFRELGSFQAIEGKTWNHPAVAGDRLYVRNAEEIACYQMEPEGEALQATAR